MKLGMIAPPQESAFARAQELGLSFVEFCINDGQDCAAFYAEVPRILQWSARYGVSVGAIGRWGTDKTRADGKLIEEETACSRLLIDAAQQLKCPVFNTGVNEVKKLSLYENAGAAIEYLAEISEYGAARGVRIATYNCRWNNFIHSDPAWTLILGHLPQIGIKYDTSHCIYEGGDPLAEIKKWGSRFYHVHIKGALPVSGKRFDDPPAGLDATNWGAVMGALYACGYDGGLSLEPHSSVWKDALGEKGLHFSIGYMKKFLL